MSYGCGTLCHPAGFRKGTAAASSSNGKQHTLPKQPAHRTIEAEDIEAHWNADQSTAPTRLWGTTKPAHYGGIEREDGQPELWLKGEYWNVDSNIRLWGLHEVRRNAASANHDVHRHDQITRIVLPPQPGARNQRSRQCVSGVVGADSCFLEAWGFDLGLRDRQARPTTLWQPVNANQMFRGERSYERDLKRMTDNFRTMRKSATLPGTIMPANVVTLRPEDFGAEAGDVASAEDAMLDRSGRTHNSRSHRFHDQYDHTVKREAAKMACAIHSPCFRSHAQGHPFKENCELSPASVYTLKYQKGGEESLRKHVSASEKDGRATARGSSLNRTKLMSTL